MIYLSNMILQSIKEQAKAEMPNEACGYLAGEALADGSLVVVERMPMTNADSSPEHFSFLPAEQFSAARRAREAGLRLLATYHSHPETPARMSDEDIRLANDTQSVYLIYSLLTDEIKAFTVDAAKTVSPFPVKISDKA